VILDLGAARRVLRRVLEQVADDLHKTHPVAVHRGSFHWKFNSELLFSRLDVGLARIRHLGHDFSHVDLNAFDPELAVI